MLIRNKTRFAQGRYLFKTSAQQDVDAVTNASSVLDSMSTLGRRKNPSLWACWHIWLLYQLGSFHQDSSMFEKWKGWNVETTWRSEFGGPSCIRSDGFCCMCRITKFLSQAASIDFRVKQSQASCLLHHFPLPLISFYNYCSTACKLGIRIQYK